MSSQLEDAHPDPPCAHGLTGGRGAAERCLECGASVTAASPDERLRESLALVYVMLTGAEPMWAEMPLDERCARAANEAQQAVLAAADREAPDPSVFPDQEETRDD